MDLCFIRKEKLRDYLSVRNIESFSKREDVATFIDTYESVLKEGFTSNDIVGEVESDGYYFFIIEENKGNYDLLFIINKYSTLDTNFNCGNIKLICPKSLSRGFYHEDESKVEVKDEEETLTGILEEEEETPTGILEQDHVFYLERYIGDKVVSQVKLDKLLVIGRSTQKCDFVISGNPNISREHCKLSFEDGVLEIQDLNSNNGTFVNGVKLGKYATKELNIGDEILLADETFKIV